MTSARSSVDGPDAGEPRLDGARGVTRKTVIILPAYNEEMTLRGTMLDFHAHCPEAEIVVVDNNSSDRTRHVADETLRELGCRGAVLSEKRQGKASALRKAFHEIEADAYVVVDADLTYPAKDLRQLLDPILAGEADMAVGDRHADGRYARENKRSFHNFGNRLVRTLINALFEAEIRDVMSGYRVMNRKFVKNFPILTGGFEIETELTVHALDKRFRIVEAPVAYRDRPDGSASKLNSVRDGLRVLKTIFVLFKDYKPLAFFATLSLLFFVASLAGGAPVLLEFARTRYITHVPLALLAVGLMIVSLLMFSVGLILDAVVRFHRFDYEHDLLRRRE